VLLAFSGGRIPIALIVMHILSVDLGTDEEMSPGDMMTLLKLRRGRYSLVEEDIAADSSVVGRTIADLDLPEECVIVAIIRRGHLILPHGDTMLQTGDGVLALTSTERLQRLAEILGKSTRPFRD
jgi:trk system potassium uptake protein TrkA